MLLLCSDEDQSDQMSARLIKNHWKDRVYFPRVLRKGERERGDSRSVVQSPRYTIPYWVHAMFDYI